MIGTVRGYETQLPPMKRGTTPVLHVRTVIDQDGNLFDFTGWTVRFLAKRWLDDSAPLVMSRNSADSGGVTILPTEQGALDIIPQASDTATLLDGVYSTEVVLYWEVEASKGASVQTVEAGTLPVVRDLG
jgi:hypothetical protein